MRSGPACEFERTDGHEYWRYFLLEQRGEESHGRRGVVDVAPRIDYECYGLACGGRRGARLVGGRPRHESRALRLLRARRRISNDEYAYGYRARPKAGSTLDVLIVESNYPEGLEGVPVIVPARGAKWAFSEIYGRLAALQAAGAAPIIKAWLAGELPLTSFP